MATQPTRVLCLLPRAAAQFWAFHEEMWEGERVSRGGRGGKGEHVPASTCSRNCSAPLTRLIHCWEDATLRNSQTPVAV